MHAVGLREKTILEEIIPTSKQILDGRGCTNYVWFVADKKVFLLDYTNISKKK